MQILNEYRDRSAEAYAADWLVKLRTPAGSPEWLRAEWVFDARFEWSCTDPEKLWQAICLIVAQPLSLDEVTYLGCGDVEDLLAENYGTFIARAISKAEVEDQFAQALRCVRAPVHVEEHFDAHIERLGLR